jgi:hypothetical protein
MTFSVLRAVPRQLQRVRGSSAASNGADPNGAGLLAASADRHSQANRALHKTGEGTFPIPNYDVLSATDASIAVQTLTTKSDVQAAIRHERANKNRKTVADAAQRRLAELSR